MAATACENKSAGCVKWFNMKTGFGFVTVVKSAPGSELAVGSELFVHHSNLKVTGEQYRFLVQGEYVSFDVSNVANGQHSCQAVNVTGMFGGKLMCETRNDAHQQHDNNKGDVDANDSYVPVLRRSSSSSDVPSRSSSSFTRSGDGDRGQRGRK
jgi:cold shock CspA family protein